MSHKKTYELVKGVYRDITTTMEDFDGDLYSSFMEVIFLDKIGKLSRKKSTAFGVMMFVLIMLITALIYWKCPCCRNKVRRGCLICMPECINEKRAQRALRRLRRQEEREETLRQLDPETRGNTSNNGHDEANNGHHEGAPGGASNMLGGVPPSPASTWD